MIRALCAAAAVALAPALARAQQGPTETVEYTVRAGDTCVAIARRFYGDGRSTPLIHRANPTMGPAPHRLRAGTVLHIPPRTGPVTGPDATLTAVHNAVEVRPPAARTGRDPSELPEARPGHPNDPLYRGTRVSTQARSSAEVTFADETQLQLAERTLIVILGATSGRVQREATARDTVLERGTLSAFLAAVDAARAPAATPALTTAAGRVSFDRGTTARVEVDEGRRTTLAVYRGRSRVTVPRQVVPVVHGYGVRSAPGARVPPPQLLPLAPTWGARPPRLVLLAGDATTLVAELRPGEAPPAPPGQPSPPPAVEWNIEVARDARFNELIANPRGPASRTRLEIPDVGAGTYFLRVSAVDADRFQGPPSEVVRAVVAPLAVAPAEHRADVTIQAGLYCGLDGAALTATTGAPLGLARDQVHTLRCAVEADGADAVEWTLAAEELPPPPVVAAPPPPPPSPPPPPPPAPWYHRLSLRVEGGGASMLSAYQRNTDVTAYLGNAPALAWGVGGQARAGMQLVRPDGGTRGAALAVELGGGFWYLPAATGSTLSAGYAVITLLGGGLRVEPFAGRLRFFVDAHAYASLRGAEANVAFDAGLGLDVPLGRVLSVGPFVRYLHVVQPGDAVTDEDARLVTGGVTLSLHPAR